MSDAYWWRLPVVSGAEPVSAFSGVSGELQTAIAAAFGPPPDLSNVVSMATNPFPHSSGSPSPKGGPTLSPQDAETLREVNRQRRTIFAQILAVVEGETTAFFIWGPGGHGKSHAVRSALELYRERVIWTTGDVSAKALFNLLRDYPTHIHVFEDMETMYKKAECQALLRAACGGQTHEERRVCWEKDGTHREDPFYFEGGVIVISNEDPRGGSLKMGAIASRFAPQKWELTEDEIAATMRDIAIGTPCKFGFSPEERLEVAEFVIDEMRKRDTQARVDLRTFCEHALPQYHLWREGVKSPHWRDVVRAKIKGGPRRGHDEIKEERYMRFACEAHYEGTDTDDRVRRWKDSTGLGKQRMYDYLKQAKERGIYDEYGKRFGT